MTSDSILDFWFKELKPAQHFAKNLALDALLRERFEATLRAGRRVSYLNGGDRQPVDWRKFWF